MKCQIMSNQTIKRNCWSILQLFFFVNSRTMYKLLILNLVFVLILSLTDSAPKKPKCPGKWFESGGCCYLVGKEEMTFLESRKFCRDSRRSNGTKTQLAPLYDWNNYVELTNSHSMKMNLRKPNNTCEELPCKWWIQTVEYEENDYVVGPCFELVQFKQGKLKVHNYVNCFEKKRPLCARHLKKSDDDIDE